MKKNNKEVINEEKKSNEKEVDTSKKEETKTQHKTQVEILNEKVHALEQESFDWKNKYYEAYANLDNLRKQIEKDNEELRKYMVVRVVESFLPGLDNLELTLKITPKDDAVKNFLIGTRMIFTTFQNSLKDLGFSSVEVNNGDSFDQDTMNAIDITEIEEGEENKVTQVYCRCYKYKDRVIRPANVVVTKLKKVSEENKEEK